jgi:argininosuccinate lyase
MTGLIASLEVDREAMRSAAGEGYATATSLADALVLRGLAFRIAHEVVGRLVAMAEAAATTLDQVSDDDVRLALTSAGDETAGALANDPVIAQALRDAASIEAALAGADVIGGTAPNRVRDAMAATRQRLGETSSPPG